MSDKSDVKGKTKRKSWAISENIVKGVTATEFVPDMNITREQIAAILGRFNNVQLKI